MVVVAVPWQGLRFMYSMAKALGRDRMRANPKLIAPMLRLWAVALSLRETASPVKKTDTRHEVRCLRMTAGCAIRCSFDRVSRCLPLCAVRVAPTAAHCRRRCEHHQGRVHHVLRPRVPSDAPPEERGDRAAAVERTGGSSAAPAEARCRVQLPTGRTHQGAAGGLCMHV